MRMLHKVASETGHELILPEMVEIEYLAYYRHEAEGALEKYNRAAADLRRTFPGCGVPTVPGSVLDDIEETPRKQLAAIFRTYPTSDAAWKEASIREANRRSPAKTVWESAGSGGRDVVIWLTLIDACQALGQEMYFVTGNSADFGKDGLRPEWVD